MELITDELIKGLPKLYSTENIKVEDKVLKLRYVALGSTWEWYLVEYNPETKIAFGYVKGLEDEWGYFSLKNFEDINNDKNSKIQIVRSKKFKPVKFKDLDKN